MNTNIAVSTENATPPPYLKRKIYFPILANCGVTFKCTNYFSGNFHRYMYMFWYLYVHMGLIHSQESDLLQLHQPCTQTYKYTYIYTHTYSSVCRGACFCRWMVRMYILIERNPPPWGGFLFTMFPHQELCVRGPPSKNLVQIPRGGSSCTRFLMREHSNRKPPRGGGFFRSICIYLYL